MNAEQYFDSLSEYHKKEMSVAQFAEHYHRHKLKELREEIGNMKALRFNFKELFALIDSHIEPPNDIAVKYDLTQLEALVNTATSYLNDSGGSWDSPLGEALSAIIRTNPT